MYILQKPPTEADIKRAVRYATEMHAGQTRLVDNRPFVTHPMRVEELIVRHSGLSGADMMWARLIALLHDVPEDTQGTHEDIAHHFGHTASDAVRAVTKDHTILVVNESKEAVVLDKIQRVLATEWHWLRFVPIADKEANLAEIPDSWSAQKALDYASGGAHVHALLGFPDNELCDMLARQVDRVRTYYERTSIST